jgi:hypothetical protein
MAVTDGGQKSTTSEQAWKEEINHTPTSQTTNPKIYNFYSTPKTELPPNSGETVATI